MTDPTLQRVLHALAQGRTPGFNFPGYFLGVSFDEVAGRRSRVTMETGPHNVDAQGNTHVGAVALLADMALAASLRSEIGVGARTATVSMTLNFLDARRNGMLTAEATLDGFVANGAERQGLTRVEVRAGGELVCTGSAAFMVLGGENATAPHPLPRRSNAAEVRALAANELDSAEAVIHRRARRALRSPTPFIEAFWGYSPRPTAAGASCTTPIGPHIGNRVGHAQGGVTFGLAAHTAARALPHSWSLISASAWYVGPGTGSRLRVRSSIAHRGMLTAVVQTRITNDEGRAVLFCTTSHARRSGV
ncbi:MAG TPA: DUF4442 domain-containing protein [Usitatibacter sp.]|nr:DUF4442 domain-containing protein [Usitatibacter sp.]